MNRTLILVATITGLSVVACTDSDDGPNQTPPEATVVSPTADPSPSPVEPEKPKNAGQASLLGTYKVIYNTVHSTITNPDTREVSKWTTTPNCPVGPCTTLVESSNDWKARAAFVKGRYRWARVVRKYYYCEIGSTRTNINATGEYSVRPTKMKLVDGVWVVTRFTGSAEFRGHKSGGCTPLPEERSILQGKLIR